MYRKKMYLENKGFMKGKWITIAVILLITNFVIMTLNSAVIETQSSIS